MRIITPVAVEKMVGPPKQLDVKTSREAGLRCARVDQLPLFPI